ncbi:hypothetical protein [Streptomyces sp. NPDC058745]|uniref:hypothetical protein n=1 Tax=Streptomyces sp. NPDC058745 TaxID=3346621 RepID=UPI0036C008AA
MSAGGPYDENVTYAITTPATDFLWEFRPEGEGRYEATGTCPRCRCAMTKVWPLGQYGAAKGPLRPRRRSADDGPWFTRCTCASAHADRPAAESHGCGAGLWIAFPPNGLPS